MFEISVADAKEAIQEMDAILMDVGGEFKVLIDRINTYVSARDELNSNPRGQYSKKLRLQRQNSSHLREFSEGIEEVSLGLNESHDRLIQTLGDVLLVCDIHDPSQMLEFYSLMEEIVGSQKIVNTLIEGGASILKILNETPTTQVTIRTINKLTNELNRISSVFTRMIYLSEYLVNTLRTRF